MPSSEYTTSGRRKKCLHGVGTTARGRPKKKLPCLKQQKLDRKEAASQLLVARSRLRSSGNSSVVDVDSTTSMVDADSTTNLDITLPRPSKKTHPPQMSTRSTRSSNVCTPSQRSSISPNLCQAIPAFTCVGYHSGPRASMHKKLRVSVISHDFFKYQSITTSNDVSIACRQIKAAQEEMSQMNCLLLACDISIDCRVSPQPLLSDTVTPDELVSFTKRCLSTTTGIISDTSVQNVLTSLGLAMTHVNHGISNQQLAEGIRLLTEYHFGSKTETFKADVIGELLPNQKITGTVGAHHVAKKVSWLVTSSVFYATVIQCVINTSAGYKTGFLR